MIHSLDAWAAMLSESYGEDASIRMQFRGVADAASVLHLQCAGMLRAFDQIGGVTTQGDCEGVALGYFSEDEESLNQALLEEQAALLRSVPPDTLAAIQKNAVEIAKIAQPDWYRSALGGRGVYVLQAIAVRRDCRGSGVFRALLTPILDAARQRETPVVLQTFKLDNLRKYEHMGFQLSKEVASDTIPLICYHMIHP